MLGRHVRARARAGHVLEGSISPLKQRGNFLSERSVAAKLEVRSAGWA